MKNILKTKREYIYFCISEEKGLFDVFVSADKGNDALQGNQTNISPESSKHTLREVVRKKVCVWERERERQRERERKRERKKNIYIQREREEREGERDRMINRLNEKERERER